MTDRTAERQEILVVDDDPRLREMLRFSLERAGFSVREAGDGLEAIAAVNRAAPDLLVLDVVMPELDGFSAWRHLQPRRIPAIFLSTRADAIDRITGLELGADDYLAKPFLPAELIARIRAVLRRANQTNNHPDGARPQDRTQTRPLLESGGVRMDPGAHRVWSNGQEIELTATEFRILHALISRPGQLIRRDQMIHAAYGGPHHISQRTLDSHLRGVRARLGPAGEAIETSTACGWRWRGDT